MATRALTPEPDAAYRGPQRCLGPCRHCAATVLGRLWQAGRFVEQVPRLTPVLGVEHRCANAEQPAPVPGENAQ